MPRRPVLLIGAAALTLGVAACGSSGSSSSSSSAAATGTSSAASGGSAYGAGAASSTTSASAPSGPATRSVSDAADPSGALKFTHTSLVAKAGKVTIHFTNTSSLGHNFTVARAGGTVVGATPTFMGATKTLTLDLKPGTYTFYCSVPGHRMAGMHGTLTVQ